MVKLLDYGLLISFYTNVERDRDQNDRRWIFYSDSHELLSFCTFLTDVNQGATLAVPAFTRTMRVPRRSSGLGRRSIRPLFSSRSSIAVFPGPTNDSLLHILVGGLSHWMPLDNILIFEYFFLLDAGSQIWQEIKDVICLPAVSVSAEPFARTIIIVQGKCI